VLFEEAVDRGLKIGDGSKDAALQSALCEGCEEALDAVERRGGRWREMERQPQMAIEPLADPWMLMSRVVVEDGAPHVCPIQPNIVRG
jgi:hypothetical protein